MGDIWSLSVLRYTLKSAMLSAYCTTSEKLAGGLKFEATTIPSGTLVPNER